MTAPTRDAELAEVEHEALERLEEEAGHVEADLDAAAAAPAPPLLTPAEPLEGVARLAVAVALPTLGAALMVGGVFTGVGARFYAGVAGLLGIALAIIAARIRRPVVGHVIVVVGLFAIGLLMVVPSGLGNVTGIRALVSEASQSGNVLRPPVPLTPGWQAVIGWLLGTVGFVAAWLALVVRRPSLALLVPLPIAAIAAISVPKDQQVASGLAVVVLFGIALGVLASVRLAGEADERPPVAYEVRRALRALPVLVLITVALVFLEKLDILFPKPYIDPTQQPQRPKTVPLSSVEDRVLFEVESSVSGPWRIGNLDVYDGRDWRLPPFAQNRLKTVSRSGVVDEDLQPGVKARFTTAGLGGAVLPTLPNTVGIIAEGPRVAYDSRNANIRVAQGQVQAGLSYTVTAAALPSIDALKAVSTPIPKDVEQFAEIPVAPPPAAQGIIDQAKQLGSDKWTQFDFLRNYVLHNVTVTGQGTPKSVTAERVQDMLAGSKEGSPFEIVAAQAMLGRWIGVPSRIGYGFDGGELINGKLQVRPRNGATFVEVYFPGFKWLPVIGVPEKAKPTVGTKPGEQQFNPNIIPSNEITVQLFLPVVVEPASVFGAQVRRFLVIAVPALLALLLLYVTYPALRKTAVRSRRRTAADAASPRARVALAYAEWRDYATDIGFRHHGDTPLMFLDRFAPDAEHTEFAWLVTRAMWGDLRDGVTPAMASTAEELSRALRRRLGQAQPATVRAVAFFSRLSLRHPYAPETDLTKEVASASEAA